MQVLVYVGDSPPKLWHKGSIMGTRWELPQHRPGSWVVSKYLLNGVSLGQTPCSEKASGFSPLKRNFPSLHVWSKEEMSPPLKAEGVGEVGLRWRERRLGR